MARIDLKIQPGIVPDDTGFTINQGGYISADKVRFWRQRPQVIGGWESVTTEPLSGVCRGLKAWTDNDNRPVVAMGTNSNLYVNVQGDQSDITPASGFTAGNVNGIGGQGFGTGEFSVQSYSQPSTVDVFALTWSMSNYGQTLLANPRGQTIFHWTNDISSPAVLLGSITEVSDDLSSYADQTAADAVYTRGTGWTFDAANDQFDCDGSQTADSDLERGAYPTIKFKWYQVEIDFSNRSAGSIQAFAGSNEGTASSETSGTLTLQFRAAATTTDLGARADADFVGSIDAIRIIERNAPDQVTAIAVPSQKRHVIAFGCNEEASNTYNSRCIRWCDFDVVSTASLADPNNLQRWYSAITTNAREFILESQGPIIGAREVADGILVWTTNEVFLMQFIGAADQTYSFTRLDADAGLIGPNAVAVTESAAYWKSKDYSVWYRPVGGTPQRIITPVRDTLKANVAPVQEDKVFAGAVTEFNEIWWFYPDARDGGECSRYVCLSLTDNVWSTGILARSAFIEASPSPIGVSPEGGVFYHERGTSANGGPIEWHIETGDIYISETGRAMQVKNYRPDIKNQRGPVTFEVYTKAYPQGDYTLAVTKTLAVDQDKADFRATGRIIKLRWSGSSAPASARIGRVNLEVQPRGRR